MFKLLYTDLLKMRSIQQNQFTASHEIRDEAILVLREIQRLSYPGSDIVRRPV